MSSFLRLVIYRLCEGNALGFVRMLKSAGVLHSADVIQYLPDPELVPRLTGLVERAGLQQPELVEAAALADTNLDNMVNCFRSKNAYFRLLVDVFSRQLSSASHPHLRLFWVILPPLYVNFVEHMMVAKEKLNKNTVEGARISDDGFALGNPKIYQKINKIGKK